MYTFSPLTNSAKEIRQESALLKLVFKKNHFTEKFLNWQYNENPDGKAVGFNAYSENGELAGHYVTQPLNAILLGKHVKGLLSLNTATHPDHQGKGLFTELANKTYQCAQEPGYEFVIGVANQNSTYGFITKLGFQLIGKLNAVISKGTVSENVFPETPVGYDFIRAWNRDSLRWRISNPEANYDIMKKKKHFEVYAASGKAGIKALLGCFDAALLPTPASEKKATQPLTLLLGTPPATKTNLSVNIPDFLRPSPLHLIFKDLTGKNKTILFNKTFFTAIDFDAY